MEWKLDRKGRDVCDIVGRRGNLFDLFFVNYFKIFDLVFNKYMLFFGFLLGIRDGVCVMCIGFDFGFVVNV